MSIYSKLVFFFTKNDIVKIFQFQFRIDFSVSEHDRHKINYRIQGASEDFQCAYEYGRWKITQIWEKKLQDLEQEELKNVGKFNVEHEAEKKKEQQEWESKMGIQKMLAEGSNELSKKKEWYEVLPLRRPGKTKVS